MAQTAFNRKVAGANPVGLIMSHKEIARFVQTQFPQIGIHGGNFEIIEDGKKSGSVVISLGGACGGCGISPMTADMLKTRLIDEFDHIENVTVMFHDSF